MPTYEYECEPCGLKFERICRMRDRNKAFCPMCRESVRRIYASPNVIDDTIIGGEIIENLTHEPIKVYSKRERARLIKETGHYEFVRHVGEPGSDKSKFTTRWI